VVLLVTVPVTEAACARVIERQRHKTAKGGKIREIFIFIHDSLSCIMVRLIIRKQASFQPNSLNFID